MPLLHRVVAAHSDFLRVLVGNLDVRVGDVLGNVDHHRSGSPGGGDVKGSLQRDREIVNVLHQIVVLHAGPCDSHAIDFLERVHPDGVGGHLSGYHHEGNGVHVGGGDSGDRVGGARPGSHQHHSGLAGGAGVAVRHVSRALLVAHQDVLDVVLLVDGVVDVKHGAARIAEQEFDALVLEKLEHDFRSGKVHLDFSPGSFANTRTDQNRLPAGQRSRYRGARPYPDCARGEPPAATLTFVRVRAIFEAESETVAPETPGRGLEPSPHS